MTGFRENVQNPNFWHLILLNPRIKIFSKYKTTLKWCPLLPSTIMQKLETFNSHFWENVQKTQFLTLNPQIKIFKENSSWVTFVTLLTPTSCKILQKTNERSVQYSKTDHRPMDRITDCQTDKGDYNLTHQVNHGPK